jgi:hypothetical protein
MSIDDTSEWNEWWNERIIAMEKVLGKSHGMHGHAVIPFDLGADIGGGADIVYFRQHVNGVVSVTSELIGRDDQVRNVLGNYELMICHRDDEHWGPNLISKLAYYTLEAELNPGETMDIGSATPDGSTINALLFCEYARFQVRERQAGLLLCIGMTSRELTACQSSGSDSVLDELKNNGIFPFTDLYRESVI